MGDGMSPPEPPPVSLPRMIPVIPVGPGMQGHRSVRPYTIFELEQVRQQSRKYGQWGPGQGWGAEEAPEGPWGGAQAQR